jgi:hypothetical protein
MSKTIKIIVSAKNPLEDRIAKSVVESDAYKYTYLKQLISRLKVVASNLQDKSEEEQETTMRNVLITERNIAAYAAEKYAEFNQEKIFESFTEIMEDIETLLN